MASIPFESFTYAEAVRRFQLEKLPKPKVDDVRVVTKPVTKNGDFCLDEDEDDEDADELFLGAWVFLEGLTVKGALTNTDPDAGPVLAVRGRLHVQRWWLTGLDARVYGDLIVDQLLLAESSRGSLRVAGETEAAVVLVSKHDTMLAGGLKKGVLFESAADAAKRVDVACLRNGRIDRGALWTRAEEGKPLLRPAGEAAPPMPKRKRREDAVFVQAHRLLERWVEKELVVFDASLDKEEFAEALAAAIENVRTRPDPGASLSEWLIDRDEVEDVMADSTELVALPD